ncbi:MAG: hypothetical protein KIS66_01195 [Fimbriimonadaceae bacterium]|nr:hypothetical protein [Fimbriimonadaceae bacterium]
MSREIPPHVARTAALVVGHIFSDREPRVVVQLLHDGRHIGVTLSVAEALELSDRIASLAQELDGGGGQIAGEDSP